MRLLAGALALALLRTGTAWAASPPPGTLAVVGPFLRSPETQAAWDRVERDLTMDPLLPVKDAEEVSAILEEWRAAGEAIEASHLAATRSVVERSEALLTGAWDAYYGFRFEEALATLAEILELASIPGDTSLRAEMAFEAHVLEGMVRWARDGKGYEAPFARAAALGPERELSSRRYSPDTIALYTRVRGEFAAAAGSLVVSASPSDAAVIVDGQQRGAPGSALPLRPGGHYVEIRAPGYESWYGAVEVDRYVPAEIRQDLASSGPMPEYARFFSERLRAGDRGYLARMVERLGVDYVLLPETGGGGIDAWIIDREGRPVLHGPVWQPGEGVENGAGRVKAMVEPLRQDWTAEEGQANLNLPDPHPVPGDQTGNEPAHRGWRKYALLLGAVLLVGSLSQGADGGGTRVEVTW